MGWLLEKIYSFAFTLFGITISSKDLTGTIRNLIDVDILLNGDKFTLYTSVEAINNAVTALGTSLLTLFFMISLIKMLTQEGVERVSWERIVLKGAEFFMLNMFITHSMEWLGKIAGIVQNSILVPVMNNMSYSDFTGFDIASELTAIAESAGTFEKWLYFAVFVILAIPYMATMIMILSQVFVRAVKLLIYMMFSPIPIAMAAEGDTFRGKAISFFMNFAGVCFEAVIIYIGSYIYAVGLSQAGISADNAIGAIIAILFMNGLFSALISLSSQLSDRMFGRG